MGRKIKIAIVSGKGGVGKSMVASSLSILFSKKFKTISLDCDVDAPNLAIWLNEDKNWRKKIPISTSQKPVIKRKKCKDCKRCEEVCPFGALRFEKGTLKFNPFLCEGCGLCEKLCPKGLIKMKPVFNGEIMEKKTKYGFKLISGKLFPGESGSGKIIDEIKKYAEKFPYDLMIIDSPPGTGCPVTASLRGANLAIVVLEPTLSGIRDAERTLKIISHFEIPWFLIINKWGINNTLEGKIKKKYRKQFLGKISYDKNIFKAVANLTPILETNLPAKEEIIFIKKSILTRIYEALK